MSSFHAIRLVTLREVRERARSKAFLFASLFTILLIVGAIGLPSMIEGGVNTFRVGVVGGDAAAIAATAQTIAEARAEEDESDPDIFEVTPFPGRSDAEAAVRSGDVDVALLPDEVLLATGPPGFFGSDVQQSLQRAAASRQVEELVEQGGADAAQVVELLTGTPLTVEAVDGGDTDEDDAIGRGVVAFGGLMLMYVAILTYGQWTLTGVTEEKTNRVVEVLLSTVRPWQLLAGKVVGIGLLGLAQFVVALGAVFLTISLTGAAEIPEVPATLVVALVVWFVLGFALYSVIYAAMGSLASRVEEAQNGALPVTLVAVAAFFLSFQVLGDPDGALGLAFTLIPFTAPFVVPVRLGLEALPVWQHLAAIGLTLATIAVLIRFAGRVYSGGLLRFGSRVKLREAWRSAED